VIDSSGENDEPNQPAGATGPKPEPASGTGAAAAEAVDLSKEEGLPTQRAWFRFGLGEYGDAGGGFGLSSPVAVLGLTVVGCALLGWFVYLMRNESYAAWTTLGGAVFTVALLTGGGWFAYHLSKNEKPGNRRVTVIRDAAEPLVTTNKTIKSSGATKRKRNARGKRNRSRRGQS
jgi:hypothetical protein